MNLFDCVERYSKICPKKEAFFCEYNDRSFSYSEFFSAVLEESTKLTDNGVSGKVVVRSSYSFQAMVQVVSLLKMGCTVIPLEILDKEAEDKIAQIKPDFVLANGACHTVSGQKIANSAFHETKEGRLIIFTSGSRSKPKAILHKESSFLTGIPERRKPSELTHAAALGFDHIGGINNWIKCVAKGSSLLLPKSFTSSNILSLIAERKPQVIASTPTFFRYLVDHTSRSFNFVKIVSYGAESMEGSLLQKLKFYCPSARFIQTYGTTETGILPIRGKGNIFDFSDNKIEHKIEDGQLFIKSETAAVKNMSQDSSFGTWISTGDFAEEIDGTKVKLLGRSDDFISVGGEKVNTKQIEFYVNKCEGVSSSKAFGLQNDILGQVVGVKVQLVPEFQEKQVLVKNAIRKICSENLSRYKVPVKIEFGSVENKESHRLKSS